MRQRPTTGSEPGHSKVRHAARRGALVLALLGACPGQTSFAAGERPEDQPFLMPIESVLFIPGQGTVAIGRVERGVAKLGDAVEIVGLGDTQETTVTGIQIVHKLLDRAEPGDTVGVRLEGIEREQVARGQVLAKPGSIAPHTRFTAEATFLTEEAGGRHTPVVTGYRPQFYFRTTEVTGTVTLPPDSEPVMPGDLATFDVMLGLPIALEHGQRFAIREGGRVVGQGVVTKIAEATDPRATVTRGDLVALVAERTELSPEQADAAVEALLKGITNALVEGRTVEIGQFGRFFIARRAARTGSNPQTGEEIRRPARKALQFRPAMALRDAIDATEP